MLDPSLWTWQEPVARGELIGEYVGELVTHEEADRRGKAYDRDHNSYLFELNRSWVIDARGSGNKLKFANHRHGPRYDVTSAHARDSDLPRTSYTSS